MLGIALCSQSHAGNLNGRQQFCGGRTRRWRRCRTHHESDWLFAIKRLCAHVFDWGDRWDQPSKDWLLKTRNYGTTARRFTPQLQIVFSNLRKKHNIDDWKHAVMRKQPVDSRHSCRFDLWAWKSNFWLLKARSYAQAARGFMPQLQNLMYTFGQAQIDYWKPAVMLKQQEVSRHGCKLRCLSLESHNAGAFVQYLHCFPGYYEFDLVFW